MIVTFDLRSESPPNGSEQVVFRMTAEDKTVIDKAARLLFMSSAQFMRCACVMAARQVAEGKQEDEALPVDRRSVSFDPDTPPGMKS